MPVNNKPPISMSDEDGREGRTSHVTEGERRSGESGIIVFGGGGGNGCAGRGCLFWIVVSVVLSVGLTVLANLVLSF